jgi:hypothetical protein
MRPRGFKGDSSTILASSRGSENSRTIMLNPAFFEKTPEEFDKKLTGLLSDKDKATGVWDPVSTVTHEYGHAVMETLAQYPTTKRRLQRFLKDVFSDPKMKVTMYGKTDASEWFAEAFMAMQFGTPKMKKSPGVEALRKFLADNPLPGRAKK